MDSIAIKCDIVLSKKLRKIVAKEASLTLYCKNIIDGKGIGELYIESETINKNLEKGETSIILTPTEVLADQPQNKAISSLFSTGNVKGNRVIEKIAITEPPEEDNVPLSKIATKKKTEVPPQFKELKNPECKEYIDNLANLIETVNKAKNKTSSINPDEAPNTRQKALLMEQKELEESIGVPCYIVNVGAATLTINDLGISLSLYSPFNLNRISAKKISRSNDLISLINANMVKFVAPDEMEKYKEMLEETLNGNDFSEQTFDNHSQAKQALKSKFNDEEPAKAKGIKRAGESRGREVEAMISQTEMSDDEPVMSAEELERPTEEEAMILNLTSGAPINKLGGSSKKTVHGNSSGQSQNQKNPTQRTIRRINVDEE